MQTFLESIDIKLCNIIESRYICPTKISLDEKVGPKPICVDGMINKKKKRYSYDVKSINAFLCT
jgi:hypothetical protein